MRRTLNVVILFSAPVGLLWGGGATGRWSPVLLPSPASVADYLWEATLDGTLIDATIVTVRRLLVGYLIGVAIGLPVGLLTSSSQTLEDTVGSLALGLQTLPSVCWV